MDETGFIQGTLLLVDTILNEFVLGVFLNLSPEGGGGALEAVWRIAFILFIAVYGWKTLVSGEFSSNDLFAHTFRILVILVLATQWPAFQLVVFDVIANTPDEISSVLINAIPAADSPVDGENAATSSTQALQQFYDTVWIQANGIMQRGSGWVSGITFSIYGLIVGAFGTVLAGVALFLIVLARIALAIFLALAPIFIIMAMFQSTRSFFEGWMRMTINYALVPVFTFAVLALCLRLLRGPLEDLGNAAIQGENAVNYIAPFVLIAFIGTTLLVQVSQMASGVAGGFALATSKAFSMAGVAMGGQAAQRLHRRTVGRYGQDRRELGYLNRTQNTQAALRQARGGGNLAPNGGSSGGSRAPAKRTEQVMPDGGRIK